MRLLAAILPCAFLGAVGAACSLGALDGFSGGGSTSSGGGNSEGGPSVSSSSSSASSSSGSLDGSPVADGQSPDGSSGGAPSYRDAVLEDGPLGYWRLGEASGLTAKDEVGKNPGGYQGGITYGAPGTTNDNDSAIGLNGSNARVSVGDVLDFIGNVAISLEAWVSLDVIDNDYKRIIAKRGDEGGYSLVCHTSFNGCALELIGSTSSSICDITLTTGQWYHLVGTYDGVTARAYRDGIEVCSQVKQVTFEKVAAPLVFGSWPAGGNWLKGRLDEIAIYDKALSIGRVKEHYARRKP